MDIHLPHILVSTLDQYHVPVIRNQLTKSLGVLFPQIRDEIIQAFDENIPLTSSE
jgi:hypothetical protein